MDEIRTDRLLLRRARMEDVAAMHAILSHPQAMRYWSSLPHPTLEDTAQWLASMVEASTETSDDYVLEKDGSVIGKAGCWRLPEIGFILHPDHWHRGLAREALQALIPRLFARHGLVEIVADVDPRNAASLGLLTRLGFRETARAERTYQLGEEWCDSLYLALPREHASS